MVSPGVGVMRETPARRRYSREQGVTVASQISERGSVEVSRAR
jgi:hypothetical protein